MPRGIHCLPVAMRVLDDKQVATHCLEDPNSDQNKILRSESENCLSIKLVFEILFYIQIFYLLIINTFNIHNVTRLFKSILFINKLKFVIKLNKFLKILFYLQILQLNSRILFLNYKRKHYWKIDDLNKRLFGVYLNYVP